jgi:SAM-dependent methyltransferase
VVSLQVLEHIWAPGDFARGLTRLCRPGGTVVLSTPNRLTFSPGLRRRERPANAFHCREYDAAELVAELARWAPRLAVEQVLGVRHGGRLRAWEAEHGGLVDAQQARAADSWAPVVAEAVRQVRAADFEVSPQGLDSSLDLVVVARRAD